MLDYCLVILLDVRCSMLGYSILGCSDARMLRCSDAQMFGCSMLDARILDARILRCSDTQMLGGWMLGFSDVQMLDDRMLPACR
jgi:hypothetical protein